MQCDICKRSGSDVKEYKSSLATKTVLYCLDCLTSGREPYEDLIDYGWEFKRFTKSYQQKIIVPTLTFYGKTVEQFNEDVLKKKEALVDNPIETKAEKGD